MGTTSCVIMPLCREVLTVSVSKVLLLCRKRCSQPSQLAMRRILLVLGDRNFEGDNVLGIESAVSWSL